MNSLGNRIQGLRKRAGLSQTELAGKINVSKSQMIRYENKGVQPPADILNKLADLLGTSVDYLINGDRDEKALATLKDAELIKLFQKVEQMPEGERSTIIKVIAALIRDYTARQTYTL